MKRSVLDLLMSLTRHRSIQILISISFLYIFMVILEEPLTLNPGFNAVVQEGFNGLFKDSLSQSFVIQREEELEEKENPIRSPKPFNQILSNLTFDSNVVNNGSKEGFSGTEKSAMEAFQVGKKLWEELERRQIIELSRAQIRFAFRPREAHPEQTLKISRLKDGGIETVLQFMMELKGLKSVDGDDPPMILRFNPRLKGDWSGKPVIELNTCYRMMWGTALRCDGLKSKVDDEIVDGQVKCEKWTSNNNSEESKGTWWLKRLIGRTKKVTGDRPYPFAEGKLFVLTLIVGLEGYHVNVDGRHVASFPYQTGFAFEGTTRLSLNGDIDVHSIFAASLPTSHPRFASRRWQAPPHPDGPVELFIGIFSAGNHFDERTAVRRSWMQHNLIKSSNVVARFFVALHSRKEVNVELKKEAEFFGDIVIVPYMDAYDLLVLKTIAICEYGVRAVSAKCIMKCDDDTFVRVDTVTAEVKKVPDGKSFYMGNINYNFKAFRYGKWGVRIEEWPEVVYPPFANGPAYIVSSDIARFVVSEYKKHKLKLFRMEDASMGMWVERFNSSRPVDYIHSLKFFQFGCIEDYYTAHYQSPRQMICLWKKLQRQERPLCCNNR
ncbi:Hydroxyproline O-galactosyltransferase GALT6 [Camellia lanceoleosa]|uniref:Hydroxyproline O-galactosyltransferase GALT6 n=1 Tax=Camellia lanceoleosa TaxID=1840588 RepID=A0ACC0GQU4_9ERIC|nr:Hydroxyproline O-galactosyltransferase GALT6 [Camellia lanceoleosa]